MNKKLWIGIYTTSLALFLLIGLPVAGLMIFENFTQSIVHSMGIKMHDVMVPLVILGVLSYLQFTIVHVILNFTILARIWGSIQDGKTPITPGSAIGFLFVPVFNLYWIFKVWGSFPAEYRNFTARHNLKLPPLSSFFIAYPIFLLMSAILILPMPVVPFVFLVVIAKACDAVNAIGTIAQARPNSAANYTPIRQPNQMLANYR